MKNFLQIADGVDVTPLLLAIKQHPELWNQFSIRKTTTGTPHTEMSDIWVRYRPFEEFDPANPKAFLEAHFPVWYPAWHALPQLRPIVFGMMARMEATHLGGILITRIPPGGKIAPHVDRGWHPEFMNCKLYLPLMTNESCWFRVEDERVTMKTGDIWWLDNTKEHEIVNEGETERMTLIVCMRRE